MDLSVLRLFAEVVRRGSFAAVARDHDLDPSAVSRTIAGLERELGLRLFHRSTRKLSPTEAALVYFDRIEPLIGELEAAHLRAADVGQRPQGTLRVAAPVSFALLNLVPLLPEFSRRYPDLAFDLVLSDAALDLLGERIDVAVRLGTVAEKGLGARALARMTTAVCASPSYLARRGQPAEPGELARHDCLLLDYPGFGNTWRFRRKGTETAVTVSGRLRTSNAVALKACALAGMGVILQARWIVGRELNEGSLIDLFPDYEVTAAADERPTAWLVYPSGTYLPLKTEMFAEFLEEKFRHGAPWEQASAPTKP